MASFDPVAFAQIPGLNPPPGTVSNLIDPYSVAPVSRVLMGITLALMWMFLILRVYTRACVTYSFGADDVLCIVSALSITSYTGVILPTLGNPLGPHQWDVPLIKLNGDLTKWSVVSWTLYAISAIFLKSALLILYRRIFRLASLVNAIIWASLVVIVLFYFICTMFSISTCAPSLDKHNMQPIDPANFNTTEFLDHYRQTQTNSACGTPLIRVAIGASIFSVVSDFYLLVLPIGLTLNVNLPFAKKVGVCAIFLTGLLACLASIVAAVYRFQLKDSPDFTWNIALTYMLTAVEINIGIMCSCMPMIPVTARTVKNSALWASMVKLVPTGRKLSYPTGATSDLSLEAATREKRGLPKIPRAKMTGLGSFIRQAYRSAGRNTEATDASTRSYNELVSVPEYHAHLKNAYSR